MRAIQGWQVNRLTTFTPSNILQDFGDEILKALEMVELIEQLREHEGAVLEIVCANPEFNGLPNEVVDITDDWTGWKPRRFGGHTLLEALRAAKTVRDIAMRETDAHGRERKPR